MIRDLNKLAIAILHSTVAIIAFVLALHSSPAKAETGEANDFESYSEPSADNLSPGFYIRMAKALIARIQVDNLKRAYTIEIDAGDFEETIKKLEAELTEILGPSIWRRITRLIQRFRESYSPVGDLSEAVADGGCPHCSRVGHDDACKRSCSEPCDIVRESGIVVHYTCSHMKPRNAVLFE